MSNNCKVKYYPFSVIQIVKEDSGIKKFGYPAENDRYCRKRRPGAVLATAGRVRFIKLVHGPLGFIDKPLPQSLADVRKDKTKKSAPKVYGHELKEEETRAIDTGRDFFSIFILSYDSSPKFLEIFTLFFKWKFKFLRLFPCKLAEINNVLLNAEMINCIKHSNCEKILEERFL